MHRNSGYSLVEVLAVVALIFIIGAVGIWSFGNAHERELCSKISQDLNLIDAAKAEWRVQNPRADFPESDEFARYDLIQPYLKVGLQQLRRREDGGSLADLAPSGVTYWINKETVRASAFKGGAPFDRDANSW